MYYDQLPDIKEVRLEYQRRKEGQQATRFVIYCRKSDERDDKRSIPAQFDHCRTLAEREKLNIVGEISENMSARSHGRPKFSKLLKSIRNGAPLEECLDDGKTLKQPPDGIIAWHPDRLARNMRDAGEVIELLDAELLKDLKFASYSFHNDSSGREHLAMEFARAKAYSDHLQDNVLRGLLRQEMKGRGTRPLPPAFTVIDDEDSDDHLKIIPSVLHHFWRTAYVLKLEGKSDELIAQMLVEQGYRDTYKKNGKRREVNVDDAYIGKHLKNPLHFGWLVTEESKEPRRADLRELYPDEFNEEFPVVVTMEDFKTIYPNKFSDTATKPAVQKHKGDYPLAGKVWCAVCMKEGRRPTMFANAPKGGSKKPSPRFSCQRCNPSHSKGMEEIFVAVGLKLRDVKLTQREHKRLVVHEWMKYQRNKSSREIELRQVNKLMADLKDEIEEAEATLNNMQYGSKKASQHAVDVQKRQVKRLHADQTRYIEREAYLKKQTLSAYWELDAFLELAKNGSGWWKDALDEEKRLMADILISNVTVEPKGKLTVELSEPFRDWATRHKDSGRDERT